MEFGGLDARRGLWVKGEMREPKRFQCWGTRRSSLRGQRIGTSAHECQYSFAAWASISLTRSMLPALGNLALDRAIAFAVTESCSRSYSCAIRCTILRQQTQLLDSEPSY